MPVMGLVRSMVVIALCGLACARPAPGSRPPAVDTARIDAIVEASQHELHLPAVSLAIMQGHSLVLAKGYGLASREASTPATAETIYPVGSISKQFTAAAVMKLVESGRIDLDTPVTTYVPEYRPTSGTPPTVRQLLQQTAGLLAWDDLPEGQAFLAKAPGADALDLDRIVELLGPVPPLFAPGTWWSYSNSNYSLLAKAIENVTGVSYEQSIERALLEPLALRSTGECASARIDHAPNQAMGYEWLDGLLYQGDHAFATPEPQAFRFRFEPAEGPATRVDWEWGELRAFARRR